jgi:hypothetical protein
MERADRVAASAHKYGGQKPMDHAGDAGDDHFRSEAERADEMLEVRFVDRCRVFDKKTPEERHKNTMGNWPVPRIKLARWKRLPYIS